VFTLRRCTALLILSLCAVPLAADVLAAHGQACGAHPCCANGSCNMAAKGGGARFDRCGDGTTRESDPPATLTTIVNLTVNLRVTKPTTTATGQSHDGVVPPIERPPRA
jgi:hypothetical protein